VDPVDGTTNFVHQFPHCCLSIAFYVNKEVYFKLNQIVSYLMEFKLLFKAQIGVVFNPITNELFHAIKGQGAFVNGQTLKHSGQKGLDTFGSYIFIS